MRIEGRFLEKFADKWTRQGASACRTPGASVTPPPHSIMEAKKNSVRRLVPVNIADKWTLQKMDKRTHQWGICRQRTRTGKMSGKLDALEDVTVGTSVLDTPQTHNPNPEA